MTTPIKVCIGDCDRILQPEEVSKIIQDTNGKEICPNCGSVVLNEDEADKLYAETEKDMAKEEQTTRSGKE